MGLELGVLLADAASLDAALAVLARSAIDSRDAALFLMDDGVRAAGDARLAALGDAGVELSLCAMDAEARGILPQARGPRFGSQHDHAAMVRDARRVVALTGDGKTAQALRSAVGYAACGLDVIVAVEPPAVGVLHSSYGNLPQAILRAIGTLRGLGHRIAPADDAPPAHLEITW